MLQLQTIFKNFFNDKNISDDHLKQFTEDHLQRIIANNGSGMFTQMLADTTTSYNDYFGKISNEDLNTAIRKSFTLAADNLIDTFKKTVSQKEGTIKGLYGKTSGAYMEFFPQGLTEYSSANKANIETLMVRMVSASAAHLTDVGAAYVQLFTDIHTNYVSARTTQLSKKGIVTANKTDGKTSRTVLELQLVKNIHYIGYNFPGDIAHCISFFDQSIIQRSQSSSSDGIGRAAGIVKAQNGTLLKDVLIDYTDLQTAHRKSKADGSYRSSNVGTGMHTLRAAKAGYQTFTIAIDIADEGDTPLNITMIPG